MLLASQNADEGTLSGLGLFSYANGVWALCFLAAGVWPRAAEVQSAYNRCLVPWFNAPQDTDADLWDPGCEFAFMATGIAVDRMMWAC